MRDLEDIWLTLPGADPALLDRLGVTFRAAQLCGGVRQGRTGLLVACYIDPPSIYRTVDEPALVDIVAFDPDEPTRWRPLVGDGVMLGEEAYREARFWRLRLPVFRTPLAWLQAGGAGVVPLDPVRFALAVTGYPRLEIIPEDPAHGAELGNLIERARRWSLPKIVVAA